MTKKQRLDTAFDIGMTFFVIIFFALAVWIHASRTDAYIGRAAQQQTTMRKI